MKYYLFAVIIFFSVLSSCKNNSHDGFVKMNGNEFILDGKKFTPIALNYIVSIQHDSDEYWARPCFEYENGNTLFYSKEDAMRDLKADMKAIRAMGFNTVRFLRIGEVVVNDTLGTVYLESSNATGEKRFYLKGSKSYNKYFSVVNELLEIVKAEGLKVIFLSRLKVENETAEAHFSEMLSHFKDNNTILAYDLFNEPLYFDLKERSKEEVYNTVKGWRKLFEEARAKQLSTIGLEGVREVDEWDPNILDVDFISYHPYEYEPEQVRNEIYWYGKYTKKPWIIGETSLPADNDSVPYEDQVKFAKSTLEQTFACGGSGYSWWQYKDVKWQKFHSDYMGIVTMTGSTKFDNATIKGTLKPTADVFKSFDPQNVSSDCIKLPNYYNYSSNKVFRLKGKVVNSKNKPVEGAIILGWNQDWSHLYHTITKEDGSFELLGPYKFYHWKLSATEYSMTRGEVNPDTAITDNDGIPTVTIPVQTLKALEFLK